MGAGLAAMGGAGRGVAPPEVLIGRVVGPREGTTGAGVPVLSCERGQGA